MKNTFMGWTQDQWHQAMDEYNRKTGSNKCLTSMYMVMGGSDREGMARYLDLMEWWKVRRVSPPPDRPVVKPTESEPMSNDRVNFGFPCKVIRKGWREDFHKGSMVFELHVLVGSAHLGAARSLPMHEIQSGLYDTEPLKRAIERDVVESLKREMFDKLFPNL